MNIVDLVFAQADPTRVALISDSRSYTYGELHEATERAAAALLAAGLPVRTPGRVPRVGLACPNGPDHVVLALAVLRTGGCLVPIASELAIPEREALIRTVGIDAVILSGGMPWPGWDGSFQPESKPKADGAKNPPQRFPWERATQLRDLDATLFTGFTVPVDTGFNEADLARLDPAFIRFSSGTTGRAKGVVLSHATLLDRIEAGNRRLLITADDRVIWILPMAHHFAVSIMLYLIKGATTVVVGSHLAEDVLTAGRESGGTVLYGAPFHHALLAAEPSGRDWPALRLAVSTAAPLPSHTAEAFYQRFGVPLSQGLGIIEVGLPFLNTADPLGRPGSVGRPLPDVCIDLRNPETGESVPVCEVGELHIRAAGMLDAYLNPWQLREDLLTRDGDASDKSAEGWFRTGDLAQLDRDGFLSLVGRAKTVINVAGMKCFPEEVEAVLQRHPGIRASRVFGRDHLRFGSVPVAEIVVQDPENPPSFASLRSHCRRALASYKIPVDFQLVTDLTRTASGKIKR